MIVITTQMIINFLDIILSMVTSELAIFVFYEDRGRYRCAGTNTQVGDIVRTTASTYADITVTCKCASLICGQ